MGDSLSEAFERVGRLFADDRFDEARVELERVFVEVRGRGDMRDAALIAAELSELNTGPLGNEAVGRGWIDRGRRLLAGEGPCVERGYLELARLACDRPDADELAESAAAALALARQFGDTELEVRALADGAVAMVTRGEVAAGLAQLDVALATLSAGEVRNPRVAGASLCAVLSTCDRAGDVERAVETIRVVERLFLEPFHGRPKLLGTHCRLALGSLLCVTGRWDEGEAALLDAIGPGSSSTRNHRVEALARLADLRVQQGRVDEAADILAGVEDAVVAAGPLARVHLDRGEPGVAAAVLRNAVKRMVGDVVRVAPLLLTLVEAEVSRSRPDDGASAARLLGSMASSSDAPCVSAMAAIADGRLAVAGGDPASAVEAYDVALGLLAAGGQRPLLVATAHLELAEAHEASGDRDAAIASARAAHAVARRLGAAGLCDRAGAILRRLGVAPPRSVPVADAIAGLTPRELDVLAGIERGDTNAQIAARLFVSPKTVEHHVGRVLAKLGVRTRTEAAAVAARGGT